MTEHSLLAAGLEDQISLGRSEIFIAVGIQITIGSIETAPLLKRPMPSIRKAVLEDVSALSDCDRAFGSGTRKGFVERAIRRGGGYILDQGGTVIAVAVLEYTFFEHGFVSLLYVSPAARRTGAGEMMLQHLVSICRTPKLFSSTNQSNHPMQALFAKAGFLTSGMIHNLDPGDPEIVYFKAVNARESGLVDP